MGIGAQLEEHASGLSAALVAVVDNAVNADNRGKKLAFELRREALNLPAAKFEQFVLYQSRPTPPEGAPEGSEAPPPAYHIIRYYFLVPGIMFHDGRALIIDYVKIKSSFEAHIKKTRSLSSDSSARVKGKIGMFGIPSLTVDITQKVAVAIGSENEQHNSFDVEMGMKQSEPPFGFMEIVKAIARNLERVMDFALEQGENNPIPLTKEEAQKLEAEAGVPVTDATPEDGEGEERLILRPIEKIGLYILFAMLMAMIFVLFSSVVFGHEGHEADFEGTHVDPANHTHPHDHVLVHSHGQYNDHQHNVGHSADRYLGFHWVGSRTHHDVVNATSFPADDDADAHSAVPLIDEPDPEPEPKPEPKPKPTSTPSISIPVTSTPTVETVKETLDEVKKQEPVIPDEIEEIVEKMPEPEVEDLREWQVYRFNRGWNLVMFSVMPDGVTTLAELYRYLIPDTVLVVNIDGCWLMFAGEGETGEIKLSANMGIAVYAPTPFTLALFGHRIKLVTSFPIHAGLNLIGFSQPPPEIATPSDLLSETGIIATLRATGGVFYLVGRVGDSGDTSLAPNEAFMAISLIDYDLEWDTPAAPMAYRRGTLATSWGAMKR